MQEIEWNKLPSHSLNLKIYISIKFDHKIQRFIGNDEDLLETTNVCVLLPCEFLFPRSHSIFTAKFKFILVWLPSRSSKLKAAFINLTKGIYPSRIYSHKAPQPFNLDIPECLSPFRFTIVVRTLENESECQDKCHQHDPISVAWRTREKVLSLRHETQSQKFQSQDISTFVLPP